MATIELNEHHPGDPSKTPDLRRGYAKWFALLLLCLFGIASIPGHAQSTTCIVDGGLAECSSQIGVVTSGNSDAQGWVYALCDDQASYIYREVAWCNVKGGTWVSGPGDPGCLNPQPVLDPVVFPWSKAFSESIHSICTATGSTDTGWGLTYNQGWNCWNGGPQYRNGMLVSDLREMTFSGMEKAFDQTCSIPWAETVFARKDRTLACPAGYKTTYAANGDLVCYHPITECPWCNVMVAAGDPITIGAGALVETQTDYASTSPGGIELRRYYNSLGYFRERGAPEMPGEQDPWKFTYEAKVFPVTGSTYVMASMLRPDGFVKYFSPAGKEIVNYDGGNATLAKLVDGGGNTTGWRFTSTTDDVELYDASGRLLSITNIHGVAQTLSYDTQGRIASVVDSYGHQLTYAYGTNAMTVTDPAGNAYRYGYDAASNLTSITYPDNNVIAYIYNEQANTGNTNLPRAMTGIVDENQSRYATFTYDSQGRATSSTRQNGVDQTSFSFSSDNSSTVVTDARGTARTFSLATIGGVIRSTGVSMPYADSSTSAGVTYDSARGTKLTRSDFNGNAISYGYEAGRNLVTQKTEAVGTAQARTTTTTWHATLHLPVEIDEPGRATTYTYDASGNLLTQTVRDTATNRARTWTYSNYTSRGQPQTIDGPRTDVADVTQLTYYPVVAGDPKAGLRATVTDALGHVTTVNSYDANGRPLTITDPNSVVTTLTYSTRGWLKTQQTAGELTSFDYDNTGLLKKVTRPNGAYLLCSYDSAHRLTDVQDQRGNKIHYVLDVSGNRIGENVLDPNGNLTQTRLRVYNALNQLANEIGANANEKTTYAYDANGNVSAINDPLNHQTLNSYDALNRLIQIVDPAGGTTKQGYDPLDHTTSVTDPRSLTTSYAIDGLGNLNVQLSPDTGNTTNTYDDAGNVLTRTDAKNQTTHYQYDALNRLTQITYADATQTTYSYDQGANGIGRLVTMTDTSGATGWSYDAQGRVTAKAQNIGGTTLTTAYVYDGTGQLTSMTLPSGNVIGYTWTNGRITGVTLNGQTPLLSNIVYQPFNGPKSWTFGDGENVVRGYDFNGRVNSMSMGMIGVPAETKNYGYDALDRLTSFATPSISLGYSYDAAGNRTSQTNASSTTSVTIDPFSNRIQGVDSAPFVYDQNGSLTADATNGYLYNARGRLASANGASYVYDGKGQRVSKLVGETKTLFAYDESGQLIGEYDTAGAANEETVWLGAMPISILTHTGGSTVAFYVHADHLNAPREVDNPQGLAVWVWNTQTFGDNTPDGDPLGIGNQFAYNLRFSGQYFDAETGLHYNYFRDYEPGAGRYVESDPIGLAGEMNVYAYVHSRPLNATDSAGLYETGGMYHNERNTVICDGMGGMAPALQPLDEGNKKCGVGECETAHEQSHINDVMRANPSVCVGKPRGTEVLTSSKKESNSTESLAFVIELECLRRKLASASCDKYCKKVLENRIKQLDDTISERGYN